MAESHPFEEFLQLSVLEQTNSHARYRANITSLFNIGEAPVGSMLMTLLLRAAHRLLNPSPQEQLPFPDPLSCSVHFLRRTAVGPCEIEVELINRGKNVAYVSAFLVQRQQEQQDSSGIRTVHLVALFGSFDRRDSQSLQHMNVPIPSGLRTDPSKAITKVPQFKLYKVCEFRPVKSDADTLESFMSLRPARKSDIWTVAAFTDYSMPHPVSILSNDPSNQHYGYKFSGPAQFWFPTYAINVYFHGRPDPSFQHLYVLMRTDISIGGVFEETMQVWEPSGRLLASARQLASVADMARNLKYSSQSANPSSVKVSKL